MPDVAVVGSGPNGLAAAVTLARAGLKVHVYEAAPSPGGGLRTAELMEPGHFHDVCSAVHPMALASPFFRQFELSRRIRLEVPEVSYGTPLDGGRAALAYRSLERTVAGLERDGGAFRRLMAPLVRHADGVADLTLNQLLRVPRDPVAAALFGARVLEQGSPLWGLRFREELARGRTVEQAVERAVGTISSAYLKDPNDPGFDFGKLYDTVKLNTYQFRLRAMLARYWPLGGQRHTIKTALNGGIFQSGNVFRNELFQIGGYKLLRGFDEESQYLSHFAVATAEYHYLVGQNSFFYVLADGGWGRSNVSKNAINYTYFGTGLGLAFETKAGIFNLAWAVGKRNDLPFNLRQSKIHIGFVNYF